MITYRLLISKHVHEIGKHVKMTGAVVQKRFLLTNCHYKSLPVKW
jgi:hypothetical protein